MKRQITGIAKSLLTLGVLLSPFWGGGLFADLEEDGAPNARHSVSPPPLVDRGLRLGTGSGQPAGSVPSDSSLLFSPTPDPTLTPAPAPTPTSTPVPTPTSTPASKPPSSAVPQLLFGIGPEADGAVTAALVQEAPARMLTSWYNGPNDLNWMQYWQDDFVPGLYEQGFALHVVIFSDGPENGTPCGRQYPISEEINADMARLARIFGGSATDAPLFVTLFTEFQTYPCQDNQWIGADAYYATLKAKMLEIRDIFHANAVNARVSIGWGGWQTRWDDPSKGGGLSLFTHFSDVMAAMDFQSFQAMQGDGNLDDVRDMTGILGSYGPVMLAHYKPDNGSQATFDADTKSMLTDGYLAEVTGLGLFAWSFMDQKNLSASIASYQSVVAAVQRYGTNP